MAATPTQRMFNFKKLVKFANFYEF